MAVAELIKRDWIAEMDEAMEEAIGSAPDTSTPMLVATDLVATLRAEDSDLLEGYLLARAPSLLREEISARWRSDRARARRNLGRSQFSEAAKAFENGDAAAMAIFATRFCIGERAWKPLGEMTGPDHLFVAESYFHNAKKAAFEGAFHKAIAKKLGDQTTAEVFTEEQYASMYGSFAAKGK